MRFFLGLNGASYAFAKCFKNFLTDITYFTYFYFITFGQPINHLHAN